MKPESKGESEGESGPIKEIRGAIEVRNATFGYDADEPLLKDINLEVAPGEVIGISGGTGSGKTSLLMLISGLLEPQSGQVLLDGVDHRDRDPTRLREKIGFFPQSPVLFRGTIMDNLTLFEESERLDAALAAAKVVGLHEVVHRLPAGYQTEVGDGAMDQLPQGTSQAITVARTLAGGHPVILFDEANSAFDTRADALLREELRALKGQATMVLVSHRPSLLALSDRRYDLEDGRLVRRDEDEAARPARTVA